MKQLELFDLDPVEGRISILPESWTNILTDGVLASFEPVLARISMERAHDKVAPDDKNVFKAFELPPEKVRIVILGQDPYFTRGTATGLAFASNTGFTPSLEVIMTAIDENFPNQEPVKGGLDLMYLARQGVLLLNTALTVSMTKKANSHTEYWTNPMKGVIKTLSEYNNNIIWLLWGDKAKSFTSVITSKYILFDTHPASVKHHSSKVWHTKCFTQCNKILEQLGQSPVNWKINWNIDDYSNF